MPPVEPKLSQGYPLKLFRPITPNRARPVIGAGSDRAALSKIPLGETAGLLSAMLQMLRAGPLKRLETALSLTELRQSNPGLYNFSDNQIWLIAMRPSRKEIIIRKQIEYQALPKKLRPTLGRIIGISLLAEPDQRFAFLDKEIAKKPTNISPLVVLASSRNFNARHIKYGDLLVTGKEIGLTASSIAKMLKSGIKVEDVKAAMAEGQGLGLTASSAVTMLQAGIKVPAVKSAMTENPELGLTASLTVTMLQAGIKVPAVKSVMTEGKQIGLSLTAYSAVTMLRAGIKVPAVKSVMIEGKQIGLLLTPYWIVKMLRAGITVPDL